MKTEEELFINTNILFRMDIEPTTTQKGDGVVQFTWPKAPAKPIRPCDDGVARRSLDHYSQFKYGVRVGGGWQAYKKLTAARAFARSS